MSKTVWKKLTSLVLAVIFVFSLIPFSSALPGAGEPLDFPWDFEDADLHGIIANDRGGTADVALSTNFSHAGGQYSILISNRTTIAAGPLIDLTKYINAGTLYRTSVWVYNPNASTVNYSIRVQTGVLDARVPGVRAEKYVTIVSANVTANAWGQLSFNLRFDEADFQGFYVETTATNALGNFYIDDVGFVEVDNSTYNFDSTAPSLKEVYKDYFLVGSIMTPSEVQGTRNEALRYHFNVVSCENLMKPVYMSTDPYIYTPEKGDIMLNAADDAGIFMHGHTLAWHSQSAPWLNPTGTTRAQAMVNLEDYIKNIAGHYSRKVISWDVVNEIMGTTAPQGDWRRSVTSTPWRTAFANGADASKGEDGTDFIYYAFVFARKYDPYSTLYYNDFSMNNANKVDAVCLMVQALNARYALEYPNDPRQLIEGVGMQNHDSVTTTAASHEAAIVKLINAGVRISITELDVQISGTNPTPAALATQAQAYAEFFYLFKKYAAHIDRVTLWGLDDVNNWRPTGYVQLFNEDLSAKPAFWAVVDPEGYLGRAAIPAPAVDHSVYQGAVSAWYAMHADLNTDTIHSQGSINAARDLLNNHPDIWAHGQAVMASYSPWAGEWWLNDTLYYTQKEIDDWARKINVVLAAAKDMLVDKTLNTGLIYVDGPESVVSGPGATVSYTISGKYFPPMSAIEIEFEVDGDYVSTKEITAAGGFFFMPITSVGPGGAPIIWTNTGSIWKGKAVLAYSNPAGVSGEVDMLNLVFNVKEGALGFSDVKITFANMSGFGATVASEIEKDTATTEYLQYYSIYDLNKDGVIDLNDLTFALQYLSVSFGDPNWEDAKIADVNVTGTVDIDDLILILANYTIPYY